MKNKDIIVLKKILEYCEQAEEAMQMFNNEEFNEDEAEKFADKIVLEVFDLIEKV